MAIVKIKTQEMITGMKLMHNAGIPAVKIAEVHNISSATYQNVRKSGWNLEKYKEDGKLRAEVQMKSWKVKQDEIAQDVTYSKIPQVGENELDVAYRKYYHILTTLSTSITKLIDVLQGHTERFDRAFPKSYGTTRKNNKGD